MKYYSVMPVYIIHVKKKDQVSFWPEEPLRVTLCDEKERKRHRQDMLLYYDILCSLLWVSVGEFLIDMCGVRIEMFSL